MLQTLRSWAKVFENDTNLKHALRIIKKFLLYLRSKRLELFMTDKDFNPIEYRRISRGKSISEKEFK